MYFWMFNKSYSQILLKMLIVWPILFIFNFSRRPSWVFVHFENLKRARDKFVTFIRKCTIRLKSDIISDKTGELIKDNILF